MSAKLNTTVNGSHSGLLPHCINPSAERIGATFVYSLLFVVSLAGNIFIGIIVYKTKTMRKPFNFFIVNMAMSDMLYPIFLFPRNLTELYLHSWLISGPLGQALCKLVPFLADASAVVSIQSLVLIAVDRFGAVVFPLRSPLISSRLYPSFILATWIVAMAIHSPYLFAFALVEYSGGTKCMAQWNEPFGDSTSYENYVLAISILLFYIPLFSMIILYVTILLKLKSHEIPGEPSVNAEKQRMKRERNVVKMSIAIVLAFATCRLPYTISHLLYFFHRITP